MKVVERANAFKYYLGACIRALRTFTRCDNDSTYIEEELKYIAPPAFYSWKKLEVDTLSSIHSLQIKVISLVNGFEFKSAKVADG